METYLPDANLIIDAVNGRNAPHELLDRLVGRARAVSSPHADRNLFKNPRTHQIQHRQP